MKPGICGNIAYEVQVFLTLVVKIGKSCRRPFPRVSLNSTDVICDDGETLTFFVLLESSVSCNH